MIYGPILRMFRGNCAKTTRTNWEFEPSSWRRSCLMIFFKPWWHLAVWNTVSTNRPFGSRQKVRDSLNLCNVWSCAVSADASWRSVSFRSFWKYPQAESRSLKKLQDHHFRNRPQSHSNSVSSLAATPWFCGWIVAIVAMYHCWLPA